MKNLITIFYLFICINAISQTKAGGFFTRIDDPYNYVTNQYIHSTQAADKDSNLIRLSRYDLTATFATINEYPYYGFDTSSIQLKFFPEKLSYLQQLVDSGQVLATHSVNHSTNWYYVHIDSLSNADQNFINNGYSYADGVDTIIINNSDTPLWTWYYHNMTDDRYKFFAYSKIVDDDDVSDSIYYPVIVPKHSVLIGIYPNANGLKKIISEAQRRFVASGLPSPNVFIHPGQEFDYYGRLDSLVENSGWCTTTSAQDTIIYHINGYKSSARKPYKTFALISLGGDDYVIADTIPVSGDTIYKLKLTGFTGDGETYQCHQKPYHPGAWFWYIDADTMKKVSDDLGLIASAVYPDGRQYIPTGLLASTTNKPFFRVAQQWGHLYMHSYMTADSAIDKLCSAYAKHYFVSTNDHATPQGNYARLDSFYTFLNSHPQIVKISMSELKDELYLKSVNVYENVLPKFDLNLNSDESPDGWVINNVTWIKDSSFVYFGDTTYITLSTNDMTCLDLWGLEKGNNLLSFYLRSSDCDSLYVQMVFRNNLRGYAQTPTTIQTSTYYFKNITKNWNEHYKQITIPDCDYVDVYIHAVGGNIDIMTPRLRKMNAAFNRVNYHTYE